MATLVQKLLDDDIFDLPNLWLTPYVCLEITDSNAHEWRNFSKDVWLGFDKKVDSPPKDKVMGPCLCDLFSECFLDLLVEIEKKSMEDQSMKQKTIQRLEDFLKCCDKGILHAKCLQKMAASDVKLKEAEIQAVLAVHLFTPLLAEPEGEVIADLVSYSSGKTTQSQKRVPEPECPYCKQSVFTGNTNFGVKKLWHGRGDIVIKNKECKKVVNVTSDEIEMEEEGRGEPASKKAKFDDDDDEDDWYSFAEVKTSNIKDLAVHQLTKEHIYTQALSQTIVNAFLAVKLNTKLENHLVPSFFVTDQCLLINFYNVNRDILLVQSKPLLLCKQGKISLEAILSLWMALNFERLVVDSKNNSYKKSGFRESLVSSGALDQYEKEVESEFLSAQKPKTACRETDYYVDITRTNRIIEKFKEKKSRR